jgi:hypothetical protein
MTDLLRPQDLKKITDDQDMEKAKKAMARIQAAEKEQAGLREAFMSRDIHPEAKTRLNSAVRRAAEQGHHQFQVFTFPASYCNDRGRRINNMEPDWPTRWRASPRRPTSSMCPT